MADVQMTGNQICVILRKKSTRAQTFYHVRTCTYTCLCMWHIIIYVYVHIGCMARSGYYYSNMGARVITSC